MTIAIGCLVLRFFRDHLPLPIGVRHMLNTVFLPQDLYEPITVDDFLFNSKGFSKSYAVKPKHLDIYEIGILFGKEGIESTYKFQGKIQIEFYFENKLLSQNIITTSDSALYKQGDMNKFSQISLFKFNVPYQNKYNTDLTLKLTVLEPDHELARYQNEARLYIAVSVVP